MKLSLVVCKITSSTRESAEKRLWFDRSVMLRWIPTAVGAKRQKAEQQSSRKIQNAGTVGRTRLSVHRPMIPDFAFVTLLLGPVLYVKYLPRCDPRR